MSTFCCANFIFSSIATNLSNDLLLLLTNQHNVAIITKDN
nr:MAG TPA: hypothetical protein [Caudoviricetes sp.]